MHLHSRYLQLLALASRLTSSVSQRQLLAVSYMLLCLVDCFNLARRNNCSDIGVTANLGRLLSTGWQGISFPDGALSSRLH